MKLAEEKFNVSKLKETKGRAEREIKGPLVAKLLSEVRDKVFLATSILPKTSAHNDCMPAAFSIVKDKTSPNVERGRSTTLRLTNAGERQLIMTKNSALKAFMESHGLSSGGIGPQAFI